MPLPTLRRGVHSLGAGRQGDRSPYNPLGDPRPLPRPLTSNPMTVSKSLLCTLPVLTLPLLAFSLRGDEVSFHPEAGASVSKEMSLSATFYLDDLSVVMDGQELPPEMMGDAMDQGLLMDAVVSVTDEYVATADGQIKALLRTYDGMSLEAGPESGAEDVEEFGELVGETVSFKWDEESEDYLKSFHESEGEESLLENLEADMDLLPLLPKGEVSEGDTWEVQGDSLASVFLPGGMPASPDVDDEGAEEMSELFQEELEAQFEEAFGEFGVSCTYTGTREEGEVKVGVIDFEFEGKGAMDLSELIQSVIDLQAGDMGIEADISATLDMEFEGKGTLLWNLEAGHVHHYQMDGELIVMADVEAEIDAQGESHSGELSAEISSEMSWVMTTDGDGE